MFKRLFFALLINSLCLYVVVQVVDGVSYTGGFKFFFISGLILGFINFSIKPILEIFSFPLIFLTGGLFAIIINAVVLRILVFMLDLLKFSELSLSFDGFSVYLISAFLFGIINWFLQLFFKK